MYDHEETTAPEILNGIDVTGYKETIEIVRAEPTLARFEFRATNAWDDGGYNVSTITDYFGAGEQQGTGERRFELATDEPPVLFGTDRAPTPVEYLLHALASCLTNTIVYKASVRGIRVDSITSEFTGDLDASKFIEISNDGRLGFREIRAKFRVSADATEEEIHELLGFSPVLDIVQNGTPVILTVEKV